MTNQAVNAYARVDLSTGVASASPHKLVLMLLDGALNSIRSARNHMQDRNIAARGENISKAISIIGELDASLNHEVGGTISSNLSMLYDYCVGRLVHANVNNQVEPLNEVGKLMMGLRETWNAIQEKGENPKHD